MEAVGLGSMALDLDVATLLNKALGRSLRLLKKVSCGLSSTCVLFQGGQLVAVVRGANAPLLQKTILDQLEAERKVLAEGRGRKVVRRPSSSSKLGRAGACQSFPFPLPFLALSAGSFIKCHPSPRGEFRRECMPTVMCAF